MSRPIDLSPNRLVPALVLFFFTLPVFAQLVFVGRGPNGETTDHRLHINLAMDIGRKGTALPHPLFHLCLLALIGGDNSDAAPGMVAVLLAAAVGVGGYLTAGALSSSNRLSPILLTLLCLALALAMPLPNWWNWPNVCRGQATPNAWYNPTGIFAMPFALALFLLGMQLLDGEGSGPVGAVAVAMVLSLLAKPNFVLAFAPCFGVMLGASLLRAVRSGRLTPGRAIGNLLLVFAPTLALLGVQYFIQFQSGSAFSSRLLYAPLEVWGLYSKNFYASVYLGLAFPLTVALLYPAQANQDRGMVLAWSTEALGIVPFALFAESGDRIIHANLSWGMMLAAHVLFVVSCAFLLRQPPGPRRWLAFGVLALQVASGCMCLERSLIKPWLAITY